MNQQWERPLIPPMFMNMEAFLGPNASNLDPNPNGQNSYFGGVRGPQPQSDRNMGLNNPNMGWLHPNNQNMGQFNQNVGPHSQGIVFQPQGLGPKESNEVSHEVLQTSGQLIGPTLPENFQQDNHDVVDIMPDDEVEMSMESATQSKSEENNGRESRPDRRQRDRGADRDNKRRDRSDRYRGERNDDRNDRDRSDRGNRYDRNDQGSRSDRSGVRRKPSKWADDIKSHGQSPIQMPTAVVMPNQMPHGGIQPGVGPEGMQSGMQGMGNMMMPQGMMPFNNMMNNQMMSNQPMPSNMSNMPMMQGNMMMMMNNMTMPTQPIMLSNAILLPALSKLSTPKRREKPPGCRTIFVGGLPAGVVEGIIAEIFQRFGPIVDIKLHKQGVCHVRFHDHVTVERSFMLTGYRFKFHNQTDNEATTLFIDYALNREDQNEYERKIRDCIPTPPPIEPFSMPSLALITEKIKSEDKFSEAAPTLVGWLERGEVNRKNASVFYTLIQASNNQTRRLYTEKMQLDDVLQTFKSSIRDKHEQIVLQFEQVAKILSAAKHQRVSDHLSKQQRKNIEMWLKMTEEVDNLKEEFAANFDDEDVERPGKNSVPKEIYEELKKQYDNLAYELEGYKNEAHLAKDEAERKFEKFKAHFIAQQALQGNQQPVYPPLPPSYQPMPPQPTNAALEPKAADETAYTTPAVSPVEAKIISLITAFLIIHPLGASLENISAYVRSILPNAPQANVHLILQRYNDVFECTKKGFGPNVVHKWKFVTFDLIKSQDQVN